MRELKEKVIYQAGAMVKRERLIYAITQNVEYLSSIHKKNKGEL